MPGASFSELLTAHLSFAKERVLADHEREMQRLSQVIEGLKSKPESVAAKKRNADQYDLDDDDDSDDSSIHEIQEAGELNGKPHRCGSKKASEYLLQSNSKLADADCTDSPGPSANPIGFVSERSRDSRTSNTDSEASTSTDSKQGDSPLPHNLRRPTMEPSQRSRASSKDRCEFTLAQAWQTNVKRSLLRSNSRRFEHDFVDTNSVGSRDTGNASLSMTSLKDFVTSTSWEATYENCLTRHMSYFMVQPSSMKHVCWNLAGLALICYDVVVVPLEIFNPSVSAFSILMLVFCNLFWTLDAVGNFFTGYLTVDGTVNIRPHSIAIRYALSWLPLDLCLIICNWIALVNVHHFDRDGLKGLDPWRTLTLFRVFRILRLLKAPEMEGFITEHIRSETTRLVASIARLIVLLLLVAHLIACCWYGLGHHLANTGHTSSWVARHHLAHKGVWHKYAFSIHWSLSQFAGENIVELETVEERTFAILVFIFAFLFATIFVSSITTLMTRLQIIAGKQSSQLSILRRYLLDNAISTPLAVRVLRNARLALNQNQRRLAEHSVDLLRDISRSLKIELHFEVHFPTLAFHTFFKHYNTVNPAGMKKVCHQAVSITWLSTHDVVFSECEMPERPSMFFVVNGELQYKQDAIDACTTLYRGNWVCEMVLWATVVQHVGTLRAMAESSLLSLDAEKFQQIVRHFPSNHARDYGKAFVLKMNEADKDESTDVPDVEVEPLCEETFPELYAVPSMGRRHSLRMGRRPSLNLGQLTGQDPLSLLRKNGMVHPE